MTARPAAAKTRDWLRGDPVYTCDGNRVEYRGKVKEVMPDGTLRIEDVRRTTLDPKLAYRSGEAARAAKGKA